MLALGYVHLNVKVVPSHTVCFLGVLSVLPYDCGERKDKLESKMTVLLFALTLEKVSHWRLRVTDEIVSVPVSPMGCHQDSCVPPERSQSHCPSHPKDVLGTPVSHQCQ